MPKVSTEHERQQRERILQAASECFHRLGYHETTVSDICEAAGLSKGGLYTYFKAKDEILAAVVEQSFYGGLEEAMAAAEGGGTAVEKLDRVAAAVTGRLFSGRSDPVSSPQLMSEIWAEASKDPNLKALCAHGYDRWKAFLADLLREGIAQGAIRRDVDPEAIAAILVAVFDGLTLMQTITERAVDWARITGTLRGALGEGILKGAS